ncbi:MAG: DNA polymerase III subunit delta [Bacteroidales bacterium]|nr:DNA polymerase III subunit delta [Bacteroidales bacterium]
MAKGTLDTGAKCREILSDVKSGRFSPVYLLMGDEPYYLDMVCDAVCSSALDEFARDFNETVCYGSDVNAETVITAARRFPMMADRQLVVVKDAQAMKDLDELAVYCENPLDTTVLVLLMRGATADKRKSLYKQVQKNGTVLESNAVKDYELPGWITSYYEGRGLSISPDAASLLAEATGTDLSRIVVETDKLLKNLPEGAANVTPADIEANVGISRQFSIFELTKELSYRNKAKALRIAAHIGQGAKFAMPMAVAPLFTHFSRILRYAALKEKTPYPDRTEVAAALQGVNPYFWKEYDAAAAIYPVRKAIAAISLLCEYDFRGKGGDGEETSQAELLIELTNKLLNI